MLTPREAMEPGQADAAERKRLEEELRRAREYRDRAQRIARIGSYLSDFQAGTIRFSDEMYHLLGLAVGDARLTSGDDFFAFIHPEERGRVRATFEQDFINKRRHHSEHRVIDANGVELWVECEGEFTLDGAGNVVSMLGTVHDVTERKRMENEVREADRRKTDFLALLSHELRNPLTPIRNCVHLLKKNASLDERGRQAAEIIDHQVNHLVALVDDLLDVTRISHGKIRLQRSRLDLAGVVRRTVEDHRSLLEGHEIAVELSNAPVWVDGDPTRLTQVVGNLLSNAAKFTPRGGKVALSLASTDGSAVLEVADSGVGIEPEMLRRVFEPFAQADNSLDRSRGGLGLGLALVKGLVEQHGGRVRAHSDGVGRGARFTISLPLSEPGTTQPGAAPQRPMGSAGRKVLIIEDNAEVADTLRDVLALDGYRVAVAYSADKGLAKAREELPDIVLCDIGLPGMDGYAVARALRQDASTASAYLVALTGYAQPEDKRRSLNAGFDAHLAKPANLEALEQLLAEAPVPGTRAP